MINRDALIEAVNWAIGEDEKRKRGLPSDWEQSQWICGTSCCIAGHIVLAKGCKPASMYGSSVIKNGVIKKTSVAASEILGLNRIPSRSLVDGMHLFDFDNTIEDIKKIANNLLGEDYFPLEKNHDD